MLRLLTDLFKRNNNKQFQSCHVACMKAKNGTENDEEIKRMVFHSSY